MAKTKGRYHRWVDAIYTIPNKMFRNKGDLTYQDVAKEWGLDQASFPMVQLMATLTTTVI